MQDVCQTLLSAVCAGCVSDTVECSVYRAYQHPFGRQRRHAEKDFLLVSAWTLMV